MQDRLDTLERFQYGIAFGNQQLGLPGSIRRSAVLNALPVSYTHLTLPTNREV